MSLPATCAEAMPRKLDAWSEKSDLLAQNLSGPKPNQQKMQNAMTYRMREHIAHWGKKKTDLEHTSMNGSGKVRSLCEQVFTQLRRAGVHAHHVQDALDDVGKKIEEYRRESRRFRTAPAL